jgi:hypothetical protein
MKTLEPVNVSSPHPEEAPPGPRKARPDDKLRAVSKDGRTHGTRGHPSRRRASAALRMRTVSALRIKGKIDFRTIRSDR